MVWAKAPPAVANVSASIEAASNFIRITISFSFIGELALQEGDGNCRRAVPVASHLFYRHFATITNI
jgi:hypothetical protein